MLRRHLSIYDPDQPEGDSRLALVLAADGQPEYLHAADAASAGRFARVIRGYLGSGRVREPVAIKVERHELRYGVGAAKFISEYQAQCDVHQDLGDGELTRVVRMLDPWGGRNQQCDTLPPTLICPESRRVLDLCCPCGALLRDEDDRCPAGCAPPENEAERLEAVRAASGCGVCAPGTCPAYWLVTRTCKLIVLELLDVDLGEYVRWRWHGQQPAPRPAWEKYERDHLPALRERSLAEGAAPGPLSVALAELDFLLGLYHDALCGVEELHRKRIPHLDLKPGNLCLALEGATARLKVIDLGQADDPRVAWAVRQKSINDDEAQKLRDPVYSAPEQLGERFRTVQCRWRPTPNGCRLRLLSPVDPAPRPGDWCYLKRPGVEQEFHRIVSAGRDGRNLTAWLIAPEDELPVAVEEDAEESPWSEPTTVGLVQQARGAADVFALGMVLLFLLVRDSDKLRPIRKELPQLHRDLAEIAASERYRGRPVRTLAGALLHRHPGRLAALAAHVRATPQPLRTVALELIGIALRAISRGVPDVSYSEHRGDCTAQTLARLAAGIAAVRNRLRVMTRDHDLHTGRVAAQRRNGLAQLRAWLGGQPFPAAPAAALPPYSRERLCETFDFLGPDAEHNCREFEALFDYYNRNRHDIEKDLQLFEKELAAKLLSVGSVHPVVEEVFRRLFSEGDTRELVQALRRFLALRGSLRELLQHVGKLLDSIDPERAAVRLSDGEAATVGAVRDALTKLNDQVQDEARNVMRLLNEWQALQERPLAEWQRLNETTSWQQFAAALLKRVQSRCGDARKWHRHVRSLGDGVPKLADLLDRTFVAPWPDTRRRFRWSVRGLWKRFDAWRRRKSFRTPVPVPGDAARQLRQTAEQLRAALARVKALPSLRLVNTRTNPKAENS